jgi:hypothetical protein
MDSWHSSWASQPSRSDVRENNSNICCAECCCYCAYSVRSCCCRGGDPAKRRIAVKNPPPSPLPARLVSTALPPVRSSATGRPTGINERATRSDERQRSYRDEQTITSSSNRPSHRGEPNTSKDYLSVRDEPRTIVSRERRVVFDVPSLEDDRSSQMQGRALRADQDEIYRGDYNGRPYGEDERMRYRGDDPEWGENGQSRRDVYQLPVRLL